MNSCLDFECINAPANLGGKAAGLFRLKSVGVMVPDGFVVIANAIPSAEEITNCLQHLFERTAYSTLAIRSSVAREDGSDRALAGLFESLLDVEATPAKVLEGVTKCRQSAQSVRAKAANATEFLPAVIVQEMIVPSWSGLLFTRDPRDGSANAMVEIVKGHLRDLVDGAAPNLRARLDVEGKKAVAGLVGDDNVEALERLARNAEMAVGGPTDVEWALCSRGLIALQARPMTALRGPCEKPGIELVAVNRTNIERLPAQLRQHDKLSLRLLADTLGIPISRGFVALCWKPVEEDITAVAHALRSWGEFIAVLLVPFRWNGKIVRRFGEGPIAEVCLGQIVADLDGHDAWFALLLKELQPTARTGIAVRLDDGDSLVEILHGHFISKGIAGATTYRLGASGVVRSVRLGNQSSQAVVERGEIRHESVATSPELTPAERVQIVDIVHRLAPYHPRAGIEFGYTPSGEFFLVDLYESRAVAPSSSRDDVICEGSVVGRVQYIDHDPAAIRASIERHVHNARMVAADDSREPVILVARRPVHVLDEIVYSAPRGTLGMVFEEGSLLCHLAVVMREHAVPGFILPNVRLCVTDGERVALEIISGFPPILRKL